MDQIGKMYQTRAMVLQEQVNQLEKLLEAKGQEDPNIVTREVAAASNPSKTPPNPFSPPGLASDMWAGVTGFVNDHPYILGTGVATVLGGMQRFEKTALLPNRILVNPKYASTPFLKMLSAWQEGKTIEDQPKGPSTIKPARPLNIGDYVAQWRAEAFNNRKVKAAEVAAAKVAADNAVVAKAQAAAKNRFSDIKTGEIAAKIDTNDPNLRDQSTALYDANGNLIQRGKLTPPGVDAVVERQRMRYPDNPVTQASLDALDSGQMRSQAVKEFGSKASQTPRSLRLGNGAAALEYPTMTGRQVAGKVAGKVLNIGGKFIDPVGEAASTALGMGARALGAAGTVAGGVAMLPMVISLFDRQAGGPDQPGSIGGPPSLEDQQAAIDQARKQEQDNIDLEKLAKNPSGRFTPEPETQSERDDRARLGLSQPVAVDMRRIAAKNGTRRGEYSTLQDRPKK